MRVVVALGGNALVERGRPGTAAEQRAGIRAAAPGLAAVVAAGHSLVLTHGNGPQAGLLASQAAIGNGDPLPVDVVGAQADGAVGYLLERELRNVLPAETPFATVLTTVEVDPADPAFGSPTTLVGPVYPAAEVVRLVRETGWAFGPDSDRWRRVVPSPEPRRIVELRPIRWLLEKNVVVICAGGGGIPAMCPPGEKDVLTGVDAIVDKDLTSELLARGVDADLLVMATDVDGVYTGWGTPEARRLRTVTPKQLRSLPFAAGSMGPKVTAAIRFVEHTGHRAAIGALPDIDAIVARSAGTLVVPE